jgi:hypothetical protein
MIRKAMLEYISNIPTGAFERHGIWRFAQLEQGCFRSHRSFRRRQNSQETGFCLRYSTFELSSSEEALLGILLLNGLVIWRGPLVLCSAVFDIARGEPKKAYILS